MELQNSGDVCISILHPPVADEQSGELPSERWNPTQNVRYLEAADRQNKSANSSPSLYFHLSLCLSCLFCWHNTTKVTCEDVT